VLVPRLEGDWQSREAPQEGGALEIGSRVRIIREPDFGALASILELPSEAQLIPSEALVRVARVQLDHGGELLLPRANLERLEEHT